MQPLTFPVIYISHVHLVGLLKCICKKKKCKSLKPHFLSKNFLYTLCSLNDPTP